MATPTHAGGIVFRQTEGRTYYLIVRAQPTPAHWVIPKGHIEPGETPEMAAIREIQEETGVDARIIDTLGTMQFNYRGKQIETIVYLLQYLGQASPQEQRECQWQTYDEAMTLLTFPDTREMLGQAQAILRRRDFDRSGRIIFNE